MFAIIDIETTGGSYRFEKVIEIAIVILEGEEIIDTYQTLINPGILIPMQITRLTGISNDMVKDAPKFFEVARKIVEITQDKIFVAHNVNFDFGFIKKEFSDLGYNYSRKKLCTVKYTRQIFPGLDSYSLGNLAKHFDIDNKARHRAMGDAMATAELLKIVLKEDSLNLFNKALRTNDVLVNMHEHLDKSLIDSLPHLAGIYYFYDVDGNIIYIGKSVNIHQRIISHLNNDHSAKALEMKSRIADIKFELTGGDLIAQLLESEKIKLHKPFYNRVLKRDGFKFGLFTYYDTLGFLQFSIKKTNSNQDAILTFNTQQSARNFIYRMGVSFGICFPETNQHRNNQCLSFLNGKCLGACVGEVDVTEYNKVFTSMLDNLLFESINFGLELEGRTEDEKGLVVIKNKKYYGFGFVPKEIDVTKVEDIDKYLLSSAYNYDNHLIVKSYIQQNELVKFYLNLT